MSKIISSLDKRDLAQLSIIIPLPSSVAVKELKLSDHNRDILEVIRMVSELWKLDFSSFTAARYFLGSLAPMTCIPHSWLNAPPLSGLRA